MNGPYKAREIIIHVCVTRNTHSQPPPIPPTTHPPIHLPIKMAIEYFQSYLRTKPGYADIIDTFTNAGVLALAWKSQLVFHICDIPNLLHWYRSPVNNYLVWVANMLVVEIIVLLILPYYHRHENKWQHRHIGNSDCLHDRPWLSPWRISISNELDITIHEIASQLSGHCDVISNRL